MAISYSNLFADLGKLIKHYNANKTLAQAIEATVDEIIAQLASNEQEAAINGLSPTAQSDWEGQHVSRRTTLAGYAAKRLTDVTTVLLELGSTDLNLGQALFRLIENMTTATASVNASVTTIGSVTMSGTNNGNGTILTTKLLDGFSSPGTRQGVSMPPHYLYADLDSELACAENHEIRCLSDSFADGQTEGAEQFQWTGNLADQANGVATFEGSGVIASLTTVQGQTSNYLSNADFETFSVTNTPDSWTIASGVVTTNIAQGAGADSYHALACLKFLGDGVATSIKVYQALTIAGLQAGRRYVVTARVKASATIAGGTLTIQLEGTGYTAGSLEKISIAPGSLPTSYTLYSFNVLLPEELPSDLALAITWGTTTPTNAKNVWIDDVGFAPVTYGAGIGVAVVRGSDPFVRNDRGTFATSVSEGVIQKFFRQVFGVQLRSNNAAGETIADSLAT